MIRFRFKRLWESLRWLVLALVLAGLLGGSVPAGPFGPITWGGTVDIGGGWGRMLQVAEGHWLCVTARYPAGTNSYLRIQQSFDYGRTWSVLSNVAEDGRTLDNGELALRPNGEILLTMRSLIPNLSYRLPVYVSHNRGASWSYRSNIDTSEGTVAQLGRGLWEPDFQGLDDGRLVVTYSNEKHTGYSQLISARVSTDDGRTWSAETWAVSQPGGGDLRPGMSQIARMANGQYILVYEVVNLGNADVHSKISDDGVSWPAGIGTRIPCQHCGPFVMSLPNGVLLISSCQNEISFSEDFGQSWQKMDPPAWPGGFVFTWPAIYFIRTNEVGVMATTNGVKLKFGTLSPRPAWPNPLTNNFNSGTDAGWSRYGGNVALANGRYLLSNEGTYGKSMMGDVFWRDGVLEAELMLTSPGNAGLMFRTTNPDFDGPDAAFGYYAGLDSAGFVILGTMDNGWKALTNAPVSVGLNAWHRLKVTMQGSQIGVYVNNVLKLSRTDARFTRGQVGVRSFQCDAQFDNVTFSNAAPLRLESSRTADRLDFSWPETSVSVKLLGGDSVSSGVTQPGFPVLQDGAWHQSVILPASPLQFYWLQAQ